MKLPSQVIHAWRDVQRNFDFLQSRWDRLIEYNGRAAPYKVLTFTVTFIAAPVGFNAFGFTLPAAFATSFVGAHATIVNATVGGNIQVDLVLPATLSTGTVYMNNPNLQNITVLFTAYGT